MTWIHVLHGPPQVLTYLDAEDAPWERRWCFACRRRTLHRWTLWDELDDLSPWPPHCAQECGECHKCATDFPGT